MKSNPPRSARLFRLQIISLALLGASIASPLRAASGTWNVDASGTWSNAANWAGTTIANGADFTANFGTVNITGTRTVSLDSSRTIGNLIFGDSGSATHDWILGNNGSVLNILTLQTSSGTPNIDVQNRAATISLILAGNQGLTKVGSGTLSLTGSNTFTGNVNVDGGALIVTSNTFNLGAASNNVFLNNSGSLMLNATSATIGTGRTITIGSTGGAIGVTAGNFTTITLASNITGSGTLTLQGANSQITLSGSNSYTGGSVVESGRVRFDTLNSLPTTGKVLINNGGVLGVGAYSNVTNWLNSGVIDTNSVGAILLNGASSETINMGAYGSLMLGAAQNATYTGALTPSGTTYRLGGGGLGGTLTLSGNGALTGARNLVVGNGTTGGYGQISLSGSNNFTGGTAVTTGSRLSVLNSGALGTGTVDVTNGELRLASGVTIANTLNLSGDPTLIANLGNGSLRGSTGINTVLGDINIVGATRISADNTAGVALNLQGNLNLANALTIQTGNTAGASVGGGVTISGTVSGLSGISKIGSGTLALTGANTYEGGTTITAGTVALGSNSAFGNGVGSVLLNGSVGLTSTSSATRTVANPLANFTGSNYVYTFGDSTGVTNGGLNFTATGTTALGNTARTFQVSNVTSFGGVFNGSGSVIKTGSGTMVLQGAHVYTGSTAVNAGTLLINGSLSNSSAVSVAAGATLGGSGQVGNVSGAGMIAPGNSPGILTASSINPSAGMDFSFQMTTGTPNWASATSPGNDVFRLTSGTPITLAMTSANSFDFYLTGAGTFTGGLYTDNNADFTALIQNATFNFYVLDAGGAIVYDGQTYSLLNTGVSWDVVQIPSANFASGTVTNGWAMAVTVVPEPSTGALLAGGLTVLFALRGRNRRQGRA